MGDVSEIGQQFPQATWNEDGWRIARAAFASARRAVQDARAASDSVRISDPDLARRLERAAGNQGRLTRAAGDRVLRFPQLPATELEARQALRRATRFKELFVELDSRLATRARQGQDITQPELLLLRNAGWLDALTAIQEVEWFRVYQLVETTRAPTTPGTRDPLARRTPRTGRRTRMQGYLPLIILGIFLLTSTPPRR